MKTAKNSITLLLASLFVFAGFTACDKVVDEVDPALTQEEKTTLLYMFEEEKLARDVYLYFNDKYGSMIFQNISGSEQKHMDAIKLILDKYGLANPASSEQGVFNLPELQTLYDDLTAQGEASFGDALRVGATIEDVDIWDLSNAIAATDKADLIATYEMLKCGSGNHMRAFAGQLDNWGEGYMPQYLSQELYDVIIAGPHEQCGL